MDAVRVEGVEAGDFQEGVEAVVEAEAEVLSIPHWHHT